MGLSGAVVIKRGLSDYSCRTASWVHSEKQPDRLSLDDVYFCVQVDFLRRKDTYSAYPADSSSNGSSILPMGAPLYLSSSSSGGLGLTLFLRGEGDDAVAISEGI